MRIGSSMIWRPSTGRRKSAQCRPTGLGARKARRFASRFPAAARSTSSMFTPLAPTHFSVPPLWPSLPNTNCWAEPIPARRAMATHWRSPMPGRKGLARIGPEAMPAREKRWRATGRRRRRNPIPNEPPMNTRKPVYSPESLVSIPSPAARFRFSWRTTF